MNLSIMSSFFFLQLVENFDFYDKKMAFKHKSVIFQHAKEHVMSCFSTVYTIMETQAVGLPIFEEEIEKSAALITAFSCLFCEREDDPYIVTEIMWDAYVNGDLHVISPYYPKVHQLAGDIIKENKKHESKTKQRQVRRNTF